MIVEKIIGNTGDQEGLFKQITSSSGSPMTMMLKTSGAGQKIIDWIKGSVPGFVDNAIKMVGEIYPIAIGAISAVSVLAKE